MADDTTKDTSATKEAAPKDTMHAGAQAAPPDFDTTSNAATRELTKMGVNVPAPESAALQGEQSTVTVGEFDPEPGSTLVTDIPPADEPDEDAPPVNPGNPAPAVAVAKQPTETPDEAGERISKESKEADSKASTAKAK